MLNRFLPILIINFVAVNGYSASVCNTLQECLNLKKQVEENIKELQSPQIGDIARDTDGKIRYMNRADAISYCSNQGQHLPSARELAQLASRPCTSDRADKEPCGAAGVSDMQLSVLTSLNYPLGVFPVNLRVAAKNVDGKIDVFYWNNQGYLPPEGDLWSNGFWSSSVISEGRPHPFFFNASRGGAIVPLINNHMSSYEEPLAVLCVRRP